jgi:hypothetical protein
MAGLTAASAASNFLTVYSGEVLAAFNAETLIKDKVRSRTITKGKSADFPTLAREIGKVHVPGEDMMETAGYTSDAAVGNTTINVDYLLVAPQFVDEVHEAMSQWDIRGELAKQAGAALGTAHDAWCLGALGALAVGGTGRITSTTGSYASAIDAARLKADIKGLAQSFDESHVPKADRYFVVSPEHWYLLLADDDVTSHDFGKGGDRSMGSVQTLIYYGFEILNSAIWNDFRDTTAAEQIASGGPLYNGGNAMRDTVKFENEQGYAIGFQKEAIGTVVLKGIKSEVNYMPNYNGNLLNAKQAIGVGGLREECVELFQMASA